LGGKQEIFGAVSKDLLGGTGKAEDAKLPGAGIIPKQPNEEGRNGDNEPERALSGQAATVSTKREVTLSRVNSERR